MERKLEWDSVVWAIPTEHRYGRSKCFVVEKIKRKFQRCPEREFETFLNTNAPKIDWWWKNGENKQDYFGIKYEYAGSIYTFYPDYLIRLVDGRLGIFEVKDAGDRDGKTYTKAKAEALQKYIVGQKNNKLLGGIVIERNKAWNINSKKDYNWEKCEHDDWGEWRELDFG